MYRKLFFASILLCLVLSLSACREKPTVEAPGSVTEGDMVFVPIDESSSGYRLKKYLGSLEELTVPSEIAGKPVVEIGNSAFYNNKTLTKVHLPETIARIENYAFDSCKKLREIVFSENIESIGFNAFSDCESLKEINLPKSLKIIEANAFIRCKSLESIYVNAALENIKRDAFSYCDGIKGVYVPDIAAWCKIKFDSAESNPLYYAEQLYVSGKLSENLTITGVETVSEYAFFGFSGLKTLTLGEGVINLGNSCFSNCSSLTRVNFSDSVKKIGMSSFNRCTSLEYVAMGRGLEYFSGLSFYGCTAIYAVEIPDLSAWCEAFFYTDNFGSANPIIYAQVIIINGREVTELVIPEGVKRISTLAFIGFKGDKVTLPKSLKTIDETAFYMCYNLTKIHFDGKKSDFSSLSVGANNFEYVTEEGKTFNE